jgi:hypothetical protein
MLTIALLMALSAPAQSRWHLPVTIEVTQDVEVKPHSELQQPGGGFSREERGVLYIGRNLKAFRIKKGQTFRMIKIEAEGGCRIQVEKREYDLPSCPWLDGFRDHQADIFRVIAAK